MPVPMIKIVMQARNQNFCKGERLKFIFKLGFVLRGGGLAKGQLRGKNDFFSRKN